MEPSTAAFACHPRTRDGSVPADASHLAREDAQATGDLDVVLVEQAPANGCFPPRFMRRWIDLVEHPTAAATANVWPSAMRCRMSTCSVALNCLPRFPNCRIGPPSRDRHRPHTCRQCCVDHVRPPDQPHFWCEVLDRGSLFSRHDVLVRSGGHAHKPVEAAADSFEMSGRDAMREAAGAAAELTRLRRRETASLTGRQSEEALELARPRRVGPCARRVPSGIRQA